MRFITRTERDWSVCSDCVYFEEIGLVDPKYPIKKGICKIFQKQVTDLAQTTCEKCTGKKTCRDCYYFRDQFDISDDEEDDMIYEETDPHTYCDWNRSHPWSDDDVCEGFEEK